METKQSPTNQGLSFVGVNCLVVFPIHFYRKNSLLILLQISLLLVFTPALSQSCCDGKPINFWHSSENRSKVSFLNILLVVAQGPAPGPGLSDEKLDYDDDTVKGEKNNCQLFYYLYNVNFTPNWSPRSL